MVELDQGGRLAGRVSLERVPPTLRSIAEHSFISRTENETDESWRIVPDLSSHILLHFHPSTSGPVMWRAGLVGARTSYCTVSVARRCFSVGVRLAPGAAAALTGMASFADRSMALSEVWPLQAARLASRISDDTQPEAIRQAVLTFLAEIGGGEARPDWRVRGLAEVLRTQPNGGIDFAAEQLGLSTRTLRRTCRESVGLSPKRMARIERIYRAVAAAIAAPGNSGSRRAADAGFADQAHMIREFQALLGETPKQFLDRRAS